MIPGEIGANELNRRCDVYRTVTGTDSVGGTTTAMTKVNTRPVRVKVSQPAGVEQLEAQRAGASFSVIVHAKPRADIRRGDELRFLDDGDDLRVKSTIMPSTPVYLRADCEQIQPEGGQP